METSNGSAVEPDEFTVEDESSLQNGDVDKRHQDDLRRFLEDPESYPHKPKTVRLIQTHASYVAIAPPFVFKIKKSVDFGFLDFSTLEKRKYFCTEEVRLNRRLCASIYEGVVPIFARQVADATDATDAAESSCALTFAENGSGVPVEYAVKMKLLSEDGFLDHMLSSSGNRAEVGTEVVRRISTKLEQFYSAQKTTPEISEWGSVEKLKISTDENFQQTKEFCGGPLPQPTYDAIRWFTDAFFDQHSALFLRRREEGRILDCHGDLHAEHIHLSDAGVCIYDCIEFNERFRSIDIASDVAFLSMDLRRNGRPDLGHLFAETIAADLNDPELLTLLPFYACYRAYIRGKVELLRSDADEVPASERDQSRLRAGKYFQVSLDYAVTAGRSVVVICMGRVGTGKSTMANRLADLLGWDWVSSDRVRKQIHHVPLFDRVGGSTPKMYSQQATDEVYDGLLQQALANVARERSTIIDATYGSRRMRQMLRKSLEAAKVPFVYIEMTADRALVEERLREREHRADVISDARLEDLANLESRFEEVDESEPQVIRVSTEGLVDGSVTNLLELLSAKLF